MSQQNVGFIGVGRMGGPMARRLLDAGYGVTIYDTSEAALAAHEKLGARRAESPAAVASVAEIVIGSLPTPPIVQAVALGPKGVIEGTQIKIFIDVSTTGSVYAKRIAEGLAKRGIVQVDAPVSGGVKGAENGTLAVMVSCSDEIYARVQAILAVIGKLFHVGKEPGQGQTMKLMNNLLSATAMAISSEAVVMGVKAGLDPQMIVDVINAGSGRNSATQDKIPRCVIPRTFDFGFALALLNKDVRLCMEEADAMGVPMIVGNSVRQLLAITAVTEGPNADMTDVVKSVERWAGVKVGSEVKAQKA
jgi:3-hydroxyisobutyrate dehydrogenase-like beta-hydroxyacid dehydrogenase